MGYSSEIWSSLKYVVNGIGNTALNGLKSLHEKGSGELIYRNNRAIKNVLIHVTRQLAMQEIEHQFATLFPRIQEKARKELRDYVLKQQDRNYKALIKKRELTDDGLGKIKTAEGKEILALNQYNDFMPEALMLYYDTDTKIIVENNNPEADEDFTFETSTLWFIDLTPQINLSSAKNVVLTPVQGRDYARKELISGGDLKFSVQGQIVGKDPGVRPDNEISKFIQIMQYGGVVKVNHYLFRNFNVSQILITSFSLRQTSYKNVQPYTFECVAVEPDEDVMVVRDTLGVINQTIMVSPKEAEYKLILDNKLAEILFNATANAVGGALNSGLDAGLDSIKMEE